jgi:hypothetical protein
MPPRNLSTCSWQHLTAYRNTSSSLCAFHLRSRLAARSRRRPAARGRQRPPTPKHRQCRRRLLTVKTRKPQLLRPIQRTPRRRAHSLDDHVSLPLHRLRPSKIASMRVHFSKTRSSFVFALASPFAWRTSCGLRFDPHRRRCLVDAKRAGCPVIEQSTNREQSGHSADRKNE